ncbi:unnamed protein product [marine sediment metagenome]|uniref:Histone-lysine N-methyltransferase, H3 lysine-79 specific n=1 Tax=marine sediment metagenome TaxID=412755 RepID=X1CYX7_9ZZZZ
MRDQGANATYGEITFEATEQLLDYLQVTSDDVLYDLGSGVGKFVVQAYLATPARKVVGVELSPTRHNLAHRIKRGLVDNGLLEDERVLTFYKENITQTDFSDATIIYLCSACD